MKGRTMGHVKRRRWSILAAVTVTAVGLLLLSSPGAGAKSSFLGDFNSRYGTAGTRLDSCSTCHTASVPARNPYGEAWRNNGHSFPAVEGLDSDGDGWTNLAEIQARTFPGNAGDFPAPPTTTTTTAPPTTTTTPPASTTTTTTTVAPPPPTTIPPDPTLPPLSLEVRQFSFPSSVTLSAGETQTRTLTVRARIEDAPRNTPLNAEFRLVRNGILYRNEVRVLSGINEYDVSVDFAYTFTAADAPQVSWSVAVVVGGQSSPSRSGTTTVNVPTPTTTTTTPPTTTVPPPTTLPPSTTVPPPPPTTTVPSPGGGNGAAVYASSCSGCHGASGQGGFGGPVAGTSLSHAQIVDITSAGSGSMPAFGTSLSTAEIDAVADYILGLGGGATTTSTTSPPATTTSGSQLYSRYCAGCHGSRADGGIGGTLVGSSLSFGAQVSVTSNGRGAMPAFAPSLTTADIEAILRYVAGIGTGSSTTTSTMPVGASGAELFGRLCVDCHGASGEGGIGGAITASTVTGPALEAIIANGTGSMPGLGAFLSSDDIAVLAAYAESLRTSAGDEEVAPDGVDTATPGIAGPSGGGRSGPVSRGDSSVSDIGVHDDIAAGPSVSAGPTPLSVIMVILLGMLVGAVVFGILPVEFNHSERDDS